VELLAACAAVLILLHAFLTHSSPRVSQVSTGGEGRGSRDTSAQELELGKRDEEGRTALGEDQAIVLDSVESEVAARMQESQESEPHRVEGASEPLVAFLNRDHITIRRTPGGLYEIGLVALPSDIVQPRQVHLWGVLTGAAPALLSTTSVFEWEHSPVFVTQGDLSVYDELFVTTEAWQEDPARILTALSRRDKQRPAVEPFCPATASVPCPVVSYELMPNGTFARMETLLEPGATRPCPAVCAF
jgi:hypothetical protein